MILILLLSFASSLKVSPIPPNLTPPTYRRSISIAYDNTENSVYIFGGGRQSGETFTNIMWHYNITSKQWGQIPINTPDIPEPRAGSSMTFLNPYIYIYGGTTDYGPSSDFWRFDINKNVWTEQPLFGDIPQEKSFSAYTSFIWKNTTYMAMFGGYIQTDSSNDLYLLNVNKLIWKHIIYKVGDTIPKNRVAASMVFYNESLYMWGLSNGFSDDHENVMVYRFDLNEEKWFIVRKNSTGISPRNYHTVAIYNDYFYVIYGVFLREGFEPKIVKRISLVGEDKWDVVEFSEKDMRLFMFGAVHINKSVYIFCGSNTDKQFNSVIKIELDTNEVVYESKNYFTFKRRHSYTLFRVGTELLLFGGTDQELLYNDLYVYDLLYETWSLVIAEGDPPSARYGHCSTIYQGLYLIVFGGEDSNGKSDGFYIFNIKTKEWKTITPNISPAGRTGCCMTSYDKFLIIQGGKTSSSVIENIMILDMHTKDIIELVNFENNAYVSLINHKCWAEAVNNTNYINLIIATGEYTTGKPVESVFSLKFNPYNSKTSVELSYRHNTTEDINWSLAGIIPLNDYFLLVGGSKWSMYASNKIFLVSYAEGLKDAKILNTLTEDSHYYYRHDIEHYGKNIFIGFSGATYANVVKKQYILSHFYKLIPENDTENGFIVCSSGTFGNNCEPCLPGSYKAEIGNQDCDLCPSGTYNKEYAATSIESCFPCHFGFYADVEGLTLCKECESTSFCPVGSDNQGQKIFYNSTMSSQPAVYVADVYDPFNGKVYYFVYFTGMILFLVYLFSPKFRDKVTKIDYFSEKHSTKINEPIIKVRTSLGGLITIIFIVFQTIYMAQTFSSYRTTNILETKTLTPAVTRDEIFTSSAFTVITKFIHYPGQCIKNDGTCSDYFYKILQDIQGEHISCKKQFNPDICIITLSCPNCILNGDPLITYSLCEYRSLSSGIQVTTSSSSSVPGYKSEETFYIGYDNGTVFRGDINSEFFFEVTRSIFESESSDWPTGMTGYHIGPQAPPNYGSSVSDIDINYQNCVGVKISLDLNGSVLVTRRSLKMQFILMVTSTIAAVFGFLEIFGLGMIFGEKFEDYVRYRASKKLNIDAVVDRRETLERSFDYMKDNENCSGLNLNIKVHSRSRSIFPSPFDVANTTQISDI
ncbi:hypothetical protein SteCoe_1471 [Stentor coeruleus]|uniref:Tyrosine-protein kinase ephrin type A/B receptor-like domain-containing protein n=1 Tax=Stentor coeruleus TaxID=5963 RepID=A0A1R2D208_9CILI|nr:hypothetical protein SteCoe_1471 [Stentor coeruleus]